MCAGITTLAVLRQTIGQIEAGSGTGEAAPRALVPLGHGRADQALGGGLSRGALHEVFAQTVADASTATAFIAGLANRLAVERTLLWIGQDFASLEAGDLSGNGFAELGLSPERLILVRAPDPVAVLKAAGEGLSCSALGAVVIEPWGAPKMLDLSATRRLALAAAKAAVPALLLRAAAAPAPSRSRAPPKPAGCSPPRPRRRGSALACRSSPPNWCAIAAA